MNKKQRLRDWKHNFRHNYLYLKRLHKKNPQVQIPMNSPLKAALQAARLAMNGECNVSLRFDMKDLRGLGLFGIWTS